MIFRHRYQIAAITDEVTPMGRKHPESAQRKAEHKQKTVPEVAGVNRAGVSRRSLLKGAAGAALAAAGASLISVIGARAQVGGLEPGPVVPTFRLPTGALDYLERTPY